MTWTQIPVMLSTWVNTVKQNNKLIMKIESRIRSRSTLATRSDYLSTRISTLVMASIWVTIGVQNIGVKI